MLWLGGLVMLGLIGLVGFLFWTNAQVERIPAEELESLAPSNPSGTAAS